MRAVLRYRRIPHVVMGRLDNWAEAFAKVRVPVMPVLEYPDGAFRNDSTPLILDLEERHPERSVIPEREADAFLAALIEDGIPLDQAAGAMRRQYGAVELVAHAVAAAAWFDGRTPSPQGALTGERRQTLERAVAAWRGAVPALAVDDPALDAPGFRDAVLV